LEGKRPFGGSQTCQAGKRASLVGDDRNHIRGFGEGERPDNLTFTEEVGIGKVGKRIEA